MTLTSKPVALIIFVIMFGGIAISSTFGWWQTESTKEPATFEDGEFAGQSNPVDIRGSYTFGDISNSFNITPEVLAQGFQITSEDPEPFEVKNLETLYADSGYEIGTSSVRLFVAFYTGLPFDTAGQEIYLPRSAAEILLNKQTLPPEQLTYLQAHTVDVTPASSTDLAPALTQEEADAPQTESTQPAPEATDEYIVKGNTIFGDLISWGVRQDIIEGIIGAPMPDPAMKVKDYATANGLDFETIKAQLQIEVDKVKK